MEFEVCCYVFALYLSKNAVISGEHRLAEGLARPSVKMVSCSRWTVGGPPLATTALSVWKSMVTCVSFITTSLSRISFRISMASVTESKTQKSETVT